MAQEQQQEAVGSRRAKTTATPEASVYVETVFDSPYRCRVNCMAQIASLKDSGPRMTRIDRGSRVFGDSAVAMYRQCLENGTTLRS